MVSPAISVVLPVYNGSRFLRESIDSILAQTFREFEVILIDDGSTDRTPAIAAEYAEKDPRIMVHRQENRGQVAAMRLGVDMARSDLIARIDADDKAFPRRFERQVEYMEMNSDVVMVGGQAIVIDEEGELVEVANRPTTRELCADALAIGNCFSHSAVTFRRSAYYECGGYQSSYAPAEDYDLFLRLSEVGGVTNLGTTVVAYRYHRENMSLSNSSEQVLRVVSANYSHDRRLAGLNDVVFRSNSEVHAARDFSEATFERIRACGIGLFRYYMQESARGLEASEGIRICRDAADFALELGAEDQLDDVIQAYPVAAKIHERPELVETYIDWFMSYEKLPAETRKAYEQALRELQKHRVPKTFVTTKDFVYRESTEGVAGCVDLAAVDHDGVYAKFVGWARCDPGTPMNLYISGLPEVKVVVARRTKRDDVAAHLRMGELNWSGFDVNMILGGSDEIDLHKITVSLVNGNVRHALALGCRSSGSDGDVPGLSLIQTGSALAPAGRSHNPGVLCVMVVRNEATRLPAVLEHHEALGVSEFLVVDNDSEDDTRQILRKRANVTVFETKERYDTGFGMDWSMALLNEHAVGRWCLLIDADELFVYPHCEQVDVSKLCTFLEYEGHEALSALVVDMYGSTPIRSTGYAAGQSLFEASPYFDPAESYVFWEEARPNIDPGWGATGGPRARLFWSFYRREGDDAYFDEESYLRAYPDVAEAVSRSAFGSGREHFESHGFREGRYSGRPPLLSALPLIKWDQGYQFHVGRHRLVGEQRPRVARMRGGLLHFKLLEDFHARALVEKGRSVHWENASEYRRYVEVLESAPDLSAWYPPAVRYQSSDTLLEHGLIRSTPRFDRYAENVEYGR